MINGISSNAYQATNTANQSKGNSSSSNTASTNDSAAAVYEKSTNTSTKKMDYSQKSAIVSQLKTDAENRAAQLKDLVEKLITKQGTSYASATYGTDLMNNSSFWNSIREGNFTVDAKTAAQAKEDISEDGYWGVKQTSDRMVDFAKALTGGDSSKIEEMRNAIQKGFRQAAKMWGGELPGISQNTYDSVMEKLDKWAAESKTATTTN